MPVLGTSQVVIGVANCNSRVRASRSVKMLRGLRARAEASRGVLLNAMHMPLARREMMPSDPPVVALGSVPACLFGAVTRLSFIRSWFSRPFFMSHLVTRPSDEMETRISPRSAP